jgi:2-(1,2-epoxy-1,2-dihydrophenyl)acetyl-CoA isomerase
VNFKTIRLTQDGPLATLQLNRPAAYNALNGEMGQELMEAVLQVKDDTAIRALIFTGSGPAFCAGGDVKGFAGAGAEASKHIDRLVIPFHAFITQLVRMPKPVLGAVNGVAAGAGFSMALACDVVLARADAVFTAAYSRIGASPDGSMTYFLARSLGLRRSLELYLTNRVLTAQEALEWGLVTRVAPVETFDRDVRALALELANGPTFAYGKAKELFYHSVNHTLETQLELEARAISACAQTEDFQQATRAFAGKTQPTFKGR